jgi:twitching motility protein PilT
LICIQPARNRLTHRVVRQSVARDVVHLVRGVVSQQLIPVKDKAGRVAALEILVNTPAVANLIRQGKLDQLENTMQSGAQLGMRTMDSAIQELFDKGVISGRNAYLKAMNKNRFETVKDQN